MGDKRGLFGGIHVVRDLNDSNDPGIKHGFDELDQKQYYSVELRGENGEVKRRYDELIVGARVQEVVEKDIAIRETAYAQAGRRECVGQGILPGVFLDEEES